MWRLLIGMALLCVAGPSAFAQFTALPQEPQETATRFGALTVGQDRRLLFKGQPLHPPMTGNNSVHLGATFRIGATDVVLVMDNGGSACPFLYYFVTVSKAGAKATPVFGTCHELTSIKRHGASIAVTIPGYRGPFEPAAARRRAERERHVFVYRTGMVTEKSRGARH
jgi:hypothetical protein